MLHKALYDKTMLTVKDTGLPFMLVDEALQKGNNFGEKYCNALEYCFDKGYEKIISIGTDCATLTTDILLKAYAMLGTQNIIGADKNGGFYLFALQKQNYSRQYFSSFNWCTPHLLKDIFSYFKSNNLQSPTLIQNGKDINSTIDLVNVFKTKITSTFLSLLFQLFNKIIIEIDGKFFKIYNFSHHIFSLRGPPSMVAVSQ